MTQDNPQPTKTCPPHVSDPMCFYGNLSGTWKVWVNCGKKFDFNPNCLGKGVEGCEACLTKAPTGHVEIEDMDVVEQPFHELPESKQGEILSLATEAANAEQADLLAAVYEPSTKQLPIVEKLKIRRSIAKTPHFVLADAVIDLTVKINELIEAVNQLREGK